MLNSILNIILTVVAIGGIMIASGEAEDLTTQIVCTVGIGSIAIGALLFLVWRTQSDTER
jgi:hypothetical protein